MNTASNILKDLTLSKERFATPEEGIAELRGKEGGLEAVHIYLENIDSKAYGRKEYFDIYRESKLSKLDAWIYENLIIESEYRSYLDKYLPLEDKLSFTDIDEYILQRHYRRKAIRGLSKRLASFDLKAWKKSRYGFRYERKTNFALKDGTLWRFDFRNPLESLFVLNDDGERYILSRGGSGGSHQRYCYTVFTVIFYELSKYKVIKHHLLKYNSLNKFEYIKTFNKPIITIDLGCNYGIPEKLMKEIIEHGVDFQKVRELCEPY